MTVALLTSRSVVATIAELRVPLEHLPEQSFVGGDVEVDEILVDSVQLVAEPGGEVLLVAEQDVDVLDERHH